MMQNVGYNPYIRIGLPRQDQDPEKQLLRDCVKGYIEHMYYDDDDDLDELIAENKDPDDALLDEVIDDIKGKQKLTPGEKKSDEDKIRNGIEILEIQKNNNNRNNNNRSVCKLKVNLSHLHALNKVTSEEANEKALSIIEDIYTGLKETFNNFGFEYDIVFADIDFNHTRVSGQSLFATGKNRTKLPLEFLEGIETVNFANTHFATKGFEALFYLKNLKKAIFDHCRFITEIDFAKFRQCEKMKEISLVAISSAIPTDFIEKLGEKFRNVEKIDITQPKAADNKNETVLFGGIQDADTFDTTVEPQILQPCGHIASKASAVTQLAKKTCSTCAKPGLQYFIDGHFPVTRFEKITEDTGISRWAVRILDYSRYPLEGRVYCHPQCKSLFTTKTLQEVLGFNNDELKDDVSTIKNSKLVECPFCEHETPLELIRVFPETTPDMKGEVSMNQNTLKDMNDHFIGKDEDVVWYDPATGKYKKTK